jgi:two-component system nitrate/nitrite response regulator NarL
MKSSCPATVVVEARLLVREALKALMAEKSYRVFCDVGCTAELGSAAISNEPDLVILGAQSADSAVAEAAAIRRLWPDSKIVLLYEHVCLADLQKLQVSDIDGCVPLFATSDSFIGMLDWVLVKGIRAMVIPGAKHVPTQPGQPEHPEPKDISVDMEALHLTAPMNAASTLPDLSAGDTRRAPTHCKLSERENQVLNGLIKGHSNKLIARACDITEATVKVHMKGVLRKIRVANRTQAAIWALENGYGTHGLAGD